MNTQLFTNVAGMHNEIDGVVQGDWSDFAAEKRPKSNDNKVINNCVKFVSICLSI